MNRLLAIAVVVLTAGCQARPAAPLLPASPAAPPAAAPFVMDEKTSLLEFHYEWPAEVAAIPALAAKLRTSMADWKAKLLSSATSDNAYRKAQGFPFFAYQGSMVWTTAGESARLLSLAGKLDEYTGGAHGNHGTHGLIWDRDMNREIAFADLFASTAAPGALLRQRWCTMLDAERARKREGHKLGGEFDRCPKLSELAIVPADTNGNGRFDAISLIADPYVAGPYAEGDYEVTLPIGGAFIAALKPQYRASFEAQPQ